MVTRCWCPCHQDTEIYGCGTCGNTGFIQKDDQVIGDVPFTKTNEEKPKFHIDEVPKRMREWGRVRFTKKTNPTIIDDGHNN